MSQVLSPPKLMTAAEFQVAEGLPAYCELLHGKVVEVNRPSKSHGELCIEMAFQKSNLHSKPK